MLSRNIIESIYYRTQEKYLMMLERRKLKRRHLIYYLRVFNKNQDKVVGHLVDITEEGFMLMSERPLKTNTVFHLKMELPAQMIGKFQISFDAKSIWCAKDINPDFYNTGFELLNLNQNHLDIIRILIARFQFQD